MSHWERAWGGADAGDAETAYKNRLHQRAGRMICGIADSPAARASRTSISLAGHCDSKDGPHERFWIPRTPEAGKPSRV